MPLSDKWINTIFKIATGSKLIKNVMTPVGGIIFFSFIISLVLLSRLLDGALEFSGFVSFPYDLIFGFLFLFPGIILSGSCVFYFIKSKGTPVPLNPPPKLIEDGPYAYSRNPMITGLFFSMTGIGIILNSVMLTFITTPLFILLNYIELKKIEEPELEKRLGEDYITYRKNVPMFIPALRKKKSE
jgi:protein-S-isoprenylcysteine O-methyltransferase Ste14